MEIKNNTRCFKDRFVFIGNLIVPTLPSAIYNRFSRKFRGMLYTKYTLCQIAKLSKAILLLAMKKGKYESLNLIEYTIKFLNMDLTSKDLLKRSFLIKNYSSLF